MNANRKHLLDIVIPCFNESKNIITVLEDIDRYLTENHTRLNVDWCHCIVVNDGSEDSTLEEVNEFLPKFIKIRTITHSKNLGYGKAIQTGIECSKEGQSDYLMIMDGDGQYSASEIEKFLFAINREKVVGVSGVRHSRADHLLRSITSTLWMKWIQASVGLKLKDLGSGQKMFKSSALPDQLSSSGAFVWVELLDKVSQVGVIREVGISHYPRMNGASTGNNLTVIIKAFAEFFQYMKLR